MREPLGIVETKVLSWYMRRGDQCKSTTVPVDCIAAEAELFDWQVIEATESLAERGLLDVRGLEIKARALR